MSTGSVDWYVRERPVRLFPWVSVTVVVKFCVTPWVMVPAVLPLARVTEMDAGGQVEKYPAEEPEPATDAVMVVVPGCWAVMVTWLVVVLVAVLAIWGLPTM